MTTQAHNKRTRDIRVFLEKIVVDAGVGRVSQLPNFADKGLVQISRDLALITGQKPEERPARKSIAGFKTRQGQIVGLRVTLRRQKMVDFFERLITMVLPRVRDFNGLPATNVDQGGALNIGFKEQAVFPEVSLEHSPIIFSLGVCIVPRKKDRAMAITTYRSLGVPLKK